MSKEFNKHHAIIAKGCEQLADYLETYYPNVRTAKYASDSLCSIYGDDFINRMAIGIYIELARANLIKDIKEKE